MSQAVECVLIGAGNRGSGIFGRYALEMPHKLKFIAVVEPDEKKREDFGQKHNIPDSMRFSDSRHFFESKGKCCEGLILATVEDQRLEILKNAVKLEYSILTEKPLGGTPHEVIKIYDLAKSYEGVFMVCHQMRYIPVYSVIKRLLDSGDYGQIVTIQCSENLSYDHMAHSFVRGIFNNDRLTPMILAKSCHDMDILRFLVNREPLRVSSFGSLGYFKKENAPTGAPAFCLDGCPSCDACPYYVLKLYFSPDTDPAYLRQMGIVSSKKELVELLRTNRFGRCVFQCDNNVVDHQVVQIEFEDGITVSFQMAGHNYLERRLIKISLTQGEIEADLSRGAVNAYTFEPRQEQVFTPAGTAGTHLGGDRIIMDAFCDAVLGLNRNVLTSVKMSLDSHLMAFAAEQSRQSNNVIRISEYESEIRSTL